MNVQDELKFLEQLRAELKRSGAKGDRFTFVFAQKTYNHMVKSELLSPDLKRDCDIIKYCGIPIFVSKNQVELFKVVVR